MRSRTLIPSASFQTLAEPLTEEEQQEKEELSPLGFSNWNKRDFQLFCRGTEVHGRDDYEGIAREVLTKTVDEVKEYATVFWDRCQELEGTLFSPPSRSFAVKLILFATYRTRSSHDEVLDGRHEAREGSSSRKLDQVKGRFRTLPASTDEDRLLKPNQREVIL